MNLRRGKIEARIAPLECALRKTLRCLFATWENLGALPQGRQFDENALAPQVISLATANDEEARRAALVSLTPRSLAKEWPANVCREKTVLFIDGFDAVAVQKAQTVLAPLLLHGRVDLKDAERWGSFRLTHTLSPAKTLVETLGDDLQELALGRRTTDAGREFAGFACHIMQVAAAWTTSDGNTVTWIAEGAFHTQPLNRAHLFATAANLSGHALVVNRFADGQGQISLTVPLQGAQKPRELHGLFILDSDGALPSVLSALKRVG